MLYDEFATNCQKLVPERTESSEGGWKTLWIGRESFANRIRITNTLEGQKGERTGIDTLYGCFIDLDVDLHYGDYFKELDSGDTFRVTSEPDDEQTPSCASFALKHFTAEKEVPPE